MRYRVRNIDTGCICGSAGDGRNYMRYSVHDLSINSQVFETTDVNVAYNYRLVMDKENAHFPNGYEVIEVGE